jgi:hypothetical protein
MQITCNYQLKIDIVSHAWKIMLNYFLTLKYIHLQIKYATKTAGLRFSAV